MQHGELAGAPVQGVRVRLVDGQYHNVDSSEMAFKIAGSMAFKEAYAKADPVLLEPIMELEVTVPDEAVGAVNGDLNSRRGRLHGMEPAGGMTTIRAEVPMAEILTYAQSLTSMTGGRGDYSMHLLRYEEVPVARRAEDDRRDAQGAGGGDRLSGGSASRESERPRGDRLRCLTPWGSLRAARVTSVPQAPGPERRRVAPSRVRCQTPDPVEGDSCRMCADRSTGGAAARPAWKIPAGGL